jgi:U3 small nucleolar RNA-associated protein 14
LPKDSRILYVNYTVQVVDNYEYELPSDFEDEEIDEDAAFTEEDKKLYAGWFDDTEAALSSRAKAHIEDGLLDSEDEGVQDEEVYNTDDFSAEVCSWP